MNPLRNILLCLALLAAGTMQSQNGGISQEMLQKIRQQQVENASTKALRNALAGTDINTLAKVAGNPAATDTYMSNTVKSSGISDQKSSGRCWLFSGLNVMRANMIAKYGLGSFMLSQNYLFFYDQLEKSNLFLQAIIDNASKPMDDRMVDWLFHNPLSDGGTFCGVQDLVMKYGVVPAEVMPENYNSNNTSRMSSILKLKLRQYGLELRSMAAEGKKAKAMGERKTEMLATIYRILAVCLGEPPSQFAWAMRNKDGKIVERGTYTPLSFYKKFVGKDLVESYVMLMNDPTRPYYKTYTVDMDRHTYDGHNWTYLNMPMADIKQIAIASIKDSTMMYMSCDVGKQYDSKTGVLSVNNFDYASLFDTDFPMTKAERISTFASASSHAMTLMGVDLDENGRPLKWQVENSWGPSSGYNGHLIMTDEWLDEYLFRLVVEKKYVPAATLELMKQKPIVLPAWDPLFMGEE
ncbi:MAG: C1 family peptidase [Bacteroidaceae bacterium]|nr:C1 family peptidase [Bacteroidaceae bacterium]